MYQTIIQLITLFLLSSHTITNTPLYLNPQAATQDRVKDLMDRMTLEEKVAQMCQYVGLDHMKKAEKELSPEELLGNDALGFYKNLHSSDVAQMVVDGKIGSFLHVLTAEEANYLQSLVQKSRLKIPLLIGIDAIHGNAMVKGTTVYPTPINMAATFTDKYAYDIARQTAIEMRATGSHWSFTPNIDVLRDPRWGRVGETFGEDPFLVGNMGVEMIRGFQQNDFTGYESVIACAKHLIAGGEPINGLNASPMDVSERTLFEVHLPPYKRAIEAGVFSIMAAHNELNGIPCHMHKGLMTDILRNQWNFDGFYVSDWMDIERIEKLHHTAENFKEATFLSVDAGMDMHMHGPHFLENVVELVKEGRLSMDRVNTACEKILTAKFNLGLFENSMVDLDEIDSKVFTPQHTELALEVAQKSITLLKNNGILPLSKSMPKKILVTGPNSNNSTILGDWHMPQPEENITTVYEGIKNLAEPLGFEVSYFDSGQNLRRIKKTRIDEAAKLSKEADLVILVVGENSLRYKWSQKTAGENMARADLRLPGKQLDLVKAVYQAGTPVVVVLVNGRPISEPWLQNNIPAIVEAWEPGSFGGQAVAEVLFGDVNPSGKLPLTVARSVGQLQMIYNHKPSHYFHKYAFEKNMPLYPFGFGLSYTQFEISEPTLSSSKINDSETITLSTVVSNTGSYKGEEIVQLYIRDRVSSVTRPVKELKGYQRVSLNPGASQKLEFDITPEMLAFYDIEMNYVVESGMFDIMVGNSSADKDLKKVSMEVVNQINF
ncbi:MAG: glycoside hydrolase family 3 N-terminal domain-containing protein [Flavobacteriaceae bacterium]|nr:glycoside hydrolase family 3 N-terminal domain-containing protein [Flavobacteriaceae bacterium]MDG2314057.1 glycoside hydrolase family 3 N-terminal domain-containing protein [Flavobacteriaceae bacterium]